MKIRFFKALFLLFIIAITLWFLAGLIIPCNIFTALTDGLHQNLSCKCIGKKIDFKADRNASPGNFGDRCMGFGIWSIGEKNVICMDTDGGKNIYTKGDALVKKDGEVLRGASDHCVFKDKDGNIWPEKTSCYGENCFIREGYCYYEEKQENKGWIGSSELIPCQNGCDDGACIK